MTVKEVKKNISELNNYYDNMIKLQELFLGHGTTPQEKVDEIKNTLEEDAKLNMHVRDLCSVVARVLGDEIERLENLIDTAVVNIK